MEAYMANNSGSIAVLTRKQRSKVAAVIYRRMPGEETEPVATPVSMRGWNNGKPICLACGHVIPLLYRSWNHSTFLGQCLNDNCPAKLS